ncbi:CBS-domain-containing protein [Hesseltinella vesiculosa]|uniref:CBS-domain-containing protein n=1 Tax=Hesseltinella vesiculosa TaxID=101127 RepID=A0A1X2GL13_9FUNG|nr:CBS-domain-containing protein [Hesseltinella vesiculosa]
MSLVSSQSKKPSRSTTYIDDTLSVSSRQRQSKKDEAIRKKIENELNKKRSPQPRQRRPGSVLHRKMAGTVAALRPAQALTIRDNVLVIEAAQLMAAKRCDCVLVVDEEDHLSGIFTAKDLAYRVVANDQVDLHAVTVADIMTPKPLCVTSDTSAQDALNLMVSRGFRHLPVCNEEGDIFGLLDITKCLYEALNKMERAYGSSRKLCDALEGVEKEWVNSPVQFVNYMETLREKMSCPDIHSVMLQQQDPAVQVSVKTHVREVAKLMKEYHTTAVLVMDHGGLAGIFTSKDIVLRVIAAGLAPDNCSVVRVMTPHPQCCLPSTTILEALKIMHDGHFLNLPVTDEDKTILGLVDVLRLTYATLEQINSIEGNGGNKFWNSIAGMDTSNDADSAISDSLSQAANSPMFRTTTPLPPSHSRASQYAASSERLVDDLQVQDHGSVVSSVMSNSPQDASSFAFKFTYGDKTYRFRTGAMTYSCIRDTVRQKIMAEHLSLSLSYVAVQQEDSDNDDWLTISYLDDEEDQVLMTTDADIQEAVQLTRKMGRDRVRLIVHDAVLLEQQSLIQQQLQSQPQMPTSQPTVASHLLDQGDAKKKRDVAKEFNLPIPQELLLPAAITFLGVTILGVFTISRLTSNSRY